MSRCTDCEFDWQMRHEDVVPYAANRIPRYRELVLPELISEPRLLALHIRPSEDVWSIVEYLAHVRDVTDFFAGRIRRVLVEDRPVLGVRFRFAELAELRSYRSEDPEVVVGQLKKRQAISMRC